MALLIAVGGMLTLGAYGFLFGRKGAISHKEWSRSFLPMATMALGGVLAAIAYRKGPASIVSPLSGAYPVVTLGFAWAILRERPTALHWIAISSVLAGFVLTTMGAGEPAWHCAADTTPNWETRLGCQMDGAQEDGSLDGITKTPVSSQPPKAR